MKPTQHLWKSKQIIIIIDVSAILIIGEIILIDRTWELS